MVSKLKVKKETTRIIIIGSLSTRVFETRTATGKEHFSCKESIVSYFLLLFISNGEKILSKNRSLPVTVRVSKTRVLKLPNHFLDGVEV